MGEWQPRRSDEPACGFRSRPARGKRPQRWNRPSRACEATARATVALRRYQVQARLVSAPAHVFPSSMRRSGEQHSIPSATSRNGSAVHPSSAEPSGEQGSILQARQGRGYTLQRSQERWQANNTFSITPRQRSRQYIRTPAARIAYRAATTARQEQDRMGPLAHSHQSPSESLLHCLLRDGSRRNSVRRYPPDISRARSPIEHA